MSDEVDQTESQPNASLFWLAYGQVAAMLGAFSFLVFLTNFFDIGLTGVVQDAVDVWVKYVRPMVGHPLQWLVNIIGWDFEVPTMAKDYVSVGAVVGASAVRNILQIKGPPGSPPRSASGFVVIFLYCLPFWPVLFLILAGGALSAWHEGDAKLLRGNINSTIAITAPLLYLVLLFTASALLPA